MLTLAVTLMAIKTALEAEWKVETYCCYDDGGAPTDIKKKKKKKTKNKTTASNPENEDCDIKKCSSTTISTDLKVFESDVLTDRTNDVVSSPVAEEEDGEMKEEAAKISLLNTTSTTTTTTTASLLPATAAIPTAATVRNNKLGLKNIISITSCAATESISLGLTEAPLKWTEDQNIVFSGSDCCCVEKKDIFCVLLTTADRTLFSDSPSIST